MRYKFEQLNLKLYNGRSFRYALKYGDTPEEPMVDCAKWLYDNYGIISKKEDLFHVNGYVLFHISNNEQAIAFKLTAC